MSGKQNLRNWAILVAVLLATGLLTAFWPSLTSTFGRSSSTTTAIEVEPEVETIHITVPAALTSIAGTDSLELSGFQVLGALAALVAAVVIGAGLVIGLVNVFLSRQVTQVVESEEFKAKLSELEKREKEELKYLRETQSASSKPGHTRSRWSVFSTDLIILSLVLLFGQLINAALFPEGEMHLFGRLVNSGSAISLLTLIIALPIILWRIRPETLEEVDKTDYAPIPWDFIAVLVTGLLVVGVGVGLMLYYSSAAA
ncbi:MAG: hypothetical protein D6706_20940 [Chloroflexi bacterium]|nr:MAG: hypothetical protein D6706_20940 [Chloroflexota bacterium]